MNIADAITKVGCNKASDNLIESGVDSSMVQKLVVRDNDAAI